MSLSANTLTNALWIGDRISSYLWWRFPPSKKVRTLLNETSRVITGTDDLETPDYRLRRMILIDSYATGGEVIVDLEGGAIVTGENGVGKTSLIRLVPIFFGENPSDISVGTERFSDFYLARSTSYVVFEYRRRDSLCLAVLYAGAEGAFSYRFIRGGYDLSYFAAPDGKTLIQSAALSTHLKTLSVPCSRTLARSEYQAIIQGRLAAGKDANAQRSLVLEYAFTAGNHRLDHIDKIVGGMFRRQADFKDFLRMTVAYIAQNQDGKQLSLSGDRARISKWPEHFSVYQDVMRHNVRMDELSGLGAKHSANQSELAALHAKFILFRDHYEAQALRLDAVHATDSAALAEQEIKHASTLSALQAKAATAEATAISTEGQVRALEVAAEKFAEEGIEARAIQVDALPTNRTLISSLIGRKSALVGEQSEIESCYAKLKLDVESAHVRREGASQEEIQKIRECYMPMFEALTAEQKVADDALRERAEIARTMAQEELNQLVESKAGFDAAAANPAPDPLLEAAAAEMQERFVEAQNKAEEAGRALEDAGKRKLATMAAYQAQEAVAAKCSQTISALEAEIGALLATAAPEEGSLLRFLREHRPGWTRDIARVIAPGLLQRTDLAPSVSDAESSIFGITMDLSRIESPLFADEAAIERAISAKQERLRSLQGEYKSASDELMSRESARSRASEQRSILDTAAQTAKSAWKGLKSDLELAQRRVQESKERARKDAKRQSAAMETKISSAKGALQAIQHELVLALREENKAGATKASALVAAREVEIDAVRRRFATAEREKDVQLSAIDNERLNALAAKGIDVTAVSELDRQINECETALRQGEGWSESVLKWRLWLDIQWAGLDKLRDDAAKHRRTEQHFSRQVETANRKWSESRREEVARLQKLSDSAKEARETSRQAAIHLQMVDDIQADGSVLASGYDMIWTLDSLAGSKVRLIAERNQLLSAIRSHVREIKNAFRKGHDSPVEQYFETMESSIDPEDDNPVTWIAPLREWYDGRHEEFLRTLLLEAQSFGRLINLFHTEVLEFERQVESFNRSIRSALKSTLLFERISHIDIAFISTVAQKAYWRPIEGFIERHRSWINGFGRDLPPATFSTDLKALMEHWEIKSGIKAERLELIDVRGEVVENGKKKAFADAKGLKDLSSNGLSYLILTTISVAFLRMIRGSARAQLTMAVDELLDLDMKNIGILVNMLRENGIDLVSACPDADVDVMVHFPNRYRVERDERGPVVVQATLEDEELLYV